MPAPTRSENLLHGLGCHVAVLAGGHGYAVSDALADILLWARKNYEWPNGGGLAGTAELERQVAANPGTPDEVAGLVRAVGDWGGLRAPALSNIANWGYADRQRATSAIAMLRQAAPTANAAPAVSALVGLPGLSLVAASKVYRFAAPTVGASVDRHSSYFFNSLPQHHAGGQAVGWVTSFQREWVNGAHTQSRLATYQPAPLNVNLGMYVNSYLPALAGIAGYLNDSGRHFDDRARGPGQLWRPTDVEMAAFYWWQQKALPEFA